MIEKMWKLIQNVAEKSHKSIFVKLDAHMNTGGYQKVLS